MSAEAAKESAENMLKKIENEYELGSDQNLREWIYGGIDRICTQHSVTVILFGDKLWHSTLTFSIRVLIVITK